MRLGRYEIYRCDVCGAEKRIRTDSDEDFRRAVGGSRSCGTSVGGAARVESPSSSYPQSLGRRYPDGISNVKVPIATERDGVRTIGAEWLDLCDECLEEIAVLAAQGLCAEKKVDISLGF